MTDKTACKGFWNMCGCLDCRKKDQQLEAHLESGKVTKDQATKDLLAAINQRKRSQ